MRSKKPRPKTNLKDIKKSLPKYDNLSNVTIYSSPSKKKKETDLL
jgi:hypothetical protein